MLVNFTAWIFITVNKRKKWRNIDFAWINWFYWAEIINSLIHKSASWKHVKVNFFKLHVTQTEVVYLKLVNPTMLKDFDLFFVDRIYAHLKHKDIETYLLHIKEISYKKCKRVLLIFWDFFFCTTSLFMYCFMFYCVCLQCKNFYNCMCFFSSSLSTLFQK